MTVIQQKILLVTGEFELGPLETLTTMPSRYHTQVYSQNERPLNTRVKTKCIECSGTWREPISKSQSCRKREINFCAAVVHDLYILRIDVNEYHINKTFFCNCTHLFFWSVIQKNRQIKPNISVQSVKFTQLALKRKLRYCGLRVRYGRI